MAKAPALAPWAPYKYTDQDIMAAKALFAGTASDAQQKHLAKLIVEGIAGYYEISFHPDHARWTDFAEGKRWVGQQFLKLTKLTPSSHRTSDT